LKVSRRGKRFFPHSGREKKVHRFIPGVVSVNFRDQGGRRACLGHLGEEREDGHQVELIGRTLDWTDSSNSTDWEPESASTVQDLA
jgi:hypothetical protein